MQDDDYPSFSEIAGCLFCIVLDVAMLMVLVQMVMSFGTGQTPLSVWLLMAAFVVVIGAVVFRLVRALFPNWLRVGRTGVVLRGVMEIEGRV